MEIADDTRLSPYHHGLLPGPSGAPDRLRRVAVQPAARQRERRLRPAEGGLQEASDYGRGVQRVNIAAAGAGIPVDTDGEAHAGEGGRVEERARGAESLCQNKNITGSRSNFCCTFILAQLLKTL